MLGCAGLRPLRAQRSPVGLSASAEVTTTRLVRETAVNRTFGGPVLGASGAVTYGRYAIDGRYLQGKLAPEAGTLGDGEELADVSLQLRVTVRPWITVGGGPRLRAFITPAGTSHWSRLEARTRIEGEIIPGLVKARFEGWYALAVEANVQGGGTGAQGAEVGLALHIPRSPLALRLSYAADRASFASGSAELLESVGVAVVYRPF